MKNGLIGQKGYRSRSKKKNETQSFNKQNQLVRKNTGFNKVGEFFMRPAAYLDDTYGSAKLDVQRFEKEIE